MTLQNVMRKLAQSTSGELSTKGGHSYKEEGGKVGERNRNKRSISFHFVCSPGGTTEA